MKMSCLFKCACTMTFIIDCMKIKRRCPIRLAVKHQFVLLIATGALFLISRRWNFVISVLRLTIFRYFFFLFDDDNVKRVLLKIAFCVKVFFSSSLSLFVVFIGWSFYRCLIEWADEARLKSSRFVRVGEWCWKTIDG